MRAIISKSKSAEQVYTTKAYRNERGKSTSRIVAKLGSMESLLPQHDFNRGKVLLWGREQAQIYTEAEKKEELKLSLNLSENKRLSFGIIPNSHKNNNPVETFLHSLTLPRSFKFLAVSATSNNRRP